MKNQALYLRILVALRTDPAAPPLTPTQRHALARLVEGLALVPTAATLERQP